MTISGFTVQLKTRVTFSFIPTCLIILSAGDSAVWLQIRLPSKGTMRRMYRTGQSVSTVACHQYATSFESRDEPYTAELNRGRESFVHCEVCLPTTNRAAVRSTCFRRIGVVMPDTSLYMYVICTSKRYDFSGVNCALALQAAASARSKDVTVNDPTYHTVKIIPTAIYIHVRDTASNALHYIEIGSQS